MKKIITSLSIIFLAILGMFFCIFIVGNKKKEILIESYDKQVSLNLGKYYVYNYEEIELNECNKYVSFNVKSKDAFYNDVLKKNENYKSVLEFKISTFDIYGFIVLDNHIFEYNILKNNVKLMELGSFYFYDKNVISEQEYSSLVNYFFAGPLKFPLSYKMLDKKSSYYVNNELKDVEYDYYSSISENNITMDMLYKIYSFIDSNLYDIVDGEIYLKGLFFRDSYQKKYEISKGYYIKIKEVNGKIIVENYDN